MVEFAGQPVAAIVAETLDAARAAAKAVELDIEPLEPILSIEEAMARNSLLCPPMIVSRGDAAAALAAAPHRISHRLRVGGQEHFYLEGQVALAVPGEDSDMVDLFLDAEPERGAAHQRAPARRRAQPRHLHRAASGRRLWRQGEQLVGGRRHGRAWPRGGRSGR